MRDEMPVTKKLRLQVGAGVSSLLSMLPEPKTEGSVAIVLRP